MDGSEQRIDLGDAVEVSGELLPQANAVQLSVVRRSGERTTLTIPAADLQRLQEYNQRLAASGCKSYDLDYELKQTDPTASPTPRIAPPKKAKAPADAAKKKQP